MTEQNYQILLQQYQAILEKTNQQLSLWYNPYGVATGILAVLIAVIAIFVAIAIWRNSKEQRDKLNAFFAEQQELANKRNDSVAKADQQYAELLKKYEARLSSATAKSKRELQKAIDDLSREKASLGVYLGPQGATGPTGIDVFGSGSTYAKNMICARCGKQFSFYEDSYPEIFSLGSKKVYCTHCGTPNTP